MHSSYLCWCLSGIRPLARCPSICCCLGGGAPSSSRAPGGAQGRRTPTLVPLLSGLCKYFHVLCMLCWGRGWEAPVLSFCLTVGWCRIIPTSQMRKLRLHQADDLLKVTLCGALAVPHGSAFLGVDGGWEGDVNFRVQPGWSHRPHNLLIPLHVASLHVGHTSGPPRLWVGEVKETVL